MVHEEIYPQQEKILKPDKDNVGNLYFDPLGIKTFADLTANLAKKVAPAMRKKGLENYLKDNRHESYTYRTQSGKRTYIYVIHGADYNKSEFHIAEKLAKSGQHVLFPRQGDLGKKRKNDVFLYDSKTFAQQKVELKSLFGDTAESVKSNLISGSGQASVIAYDIQSTIKKNWLVDGLRTGWTKDTKRVMLNWKGQWYDVKKTVLFTQAIYDLLR
jgi:hypothetical protein